MTTDLRKELFSRENGQIQVLLALSLGIVGMTGILFSAGNPFQRFVGTLNPVLGSVFIVTSGGFLLVSLSKKGWFAVFKANNPEGVWRASRVAAILGIIMILFDTKFVFPADMNVAFPESLLFYPVIGFWVEILFHVFPVSALMFFWTSIWKNADPNRLTGGTILAVACLEPTYQTLWGSSNHFTLWAVGYVGLHVFLINICQLCIFRKYDFVSMYAFRLIYYLFWHIGWGYVRLKFLF